RDDIRQKFLHKQWKRNKTSLYLSDIWERGGKTGSVLLYVRPDGNGQYCFSYYEASEFEPMYDGDGTLTSVVINTTYGDNRYYRLRLSATQIEKWDSNKPIETAVPDVVLPNPYGYVPCVVIDNRPTGPGRRGKTEFCDALNQIEAHDWELEQIHNNLEFYGEGIFYSSRDRTEMIEAGLVQTIGVAENQGYRSPVGRQRDRVKARRVVDNIEQGEVPPTFVTPPTIPTETMTFMKRFAEEIRTALGGVAETTNALERLVDAGVIKVVMARAIATAARRATSYLDYGLCAAYEMILQMAEHDGIVPVVDDDTTVLYRHLGDVFQDSAQDTLTKSIVSRNLLRLGVNVEECIRYLFPDKRDPEIAQLLQDGFAYEFLNGIATVARTLISARDDKGAYAIEVESIIGKVLDARPNTRADNSSSPESGFVLSKDSGSSVTLPEVSIGFSSTNGSPNSSTNGASNSSS
ncbi:MAG: hypothetical protein ACRCZS_17720, partial [Chroococcidiopsis sp.]